MSSTYGLICLNHEPAIEFGDRESVYDPEPMIAAAKYPADHEAASGHERCDLVVARYSYPIVEILCPGKGERALGCRWHDKPVGISDDHMRLLIAAYQSSDVPDWVTEPFSSRCWKRDRVLRLGPLLGLEPPSAHAEPKLHRLTVVPRGPSGTGYTITHPPGHDADCPIGLATAPLPSGDGTYELALEYNAARWTEVGTP